MGAPQYDEDGTSFGADSLYSRETSAEPVLSGTVSFSSTPLPSGIIPGHAHTASGSTTPSVSSYGSTLGYGSATMTTTTTATSHGYGPTQSYGSAQSYASAQGFGSANTGFSGSSSGSPAGRASGADPHTSGNGKGRKRRAVTPVKLEGGTDMDPVELKRAKRQQRNRESAQKSRDEKKKQFEDLKARVEYLEDENCKLKAANAMLKEELAARGGGHSVVPRVAAGVSFMLLLSVGVLISAPGDGIGQGLLASHRSGLAPLADEYAGTGLVLMGEQMPRQHGRTLLAQLDGPSPPEIIGEGPGVSTPVVVASHHRAREGAGSLVMPRAASASPEFFVTDRSYVLCDKARTVAVNSDGSGQGLPNQGHKPIISVIVPASAVNRTNMNGHAAAPAHEPSGSGSGPRAGDEEEDDGEEDSHAASLAPAGSLPKVVMETLPVPRRGFGSFGKISKRFAPVSQEPDMVEIRCKVLDIQPLSAMTSSFH